MFRQFIRAFKLLPVVHSSFREIIKSGGKKHKKKVSLSVSVKGIALIVIICALRVCALHCTFNKFIFKGGKMFIDLNTCYLWLNFIAHSCFTVNFFPVNFKDKTKSSNENFSNISTWREKKSRICKYLYMEIFSLVYAL